MGKRGKKRHRKQRTAKAAKLNGFDFGLAQMAMAVSDFQFNNLLRQASIGACAYGGGYSTEAGDNVPYISLAASKIEPLKAALEILQRWDRAPGDDGFDLHFILRQDGGYLLTISPDFTALLHRVNKSDRFFSQFGMVVSWMKDFPKRGPWLADFQNHVARRAAPFVFTGCEWVSGQNIGRHAPGLPEILKFEAHFSKEGSTAEGTFGDAMLKLGREGKGSAHRALPPKPTQTPEGIRERRKDQLKRHFPITLWRAQAQNAFEAFRTRNSNLDIQRWQWEQAICNTTLSTELTGAPHYRNLSERKLVPAISQRLLDRIELVDMTPNPPVDDQTLIKQISLDSRYLLRQRGCRHIPDDSGLLQARLIEEGLF